MSKIVDIRGREIIDSRGNPTVEADVMLDSGALGRAAVPSGASTGTREAVELRDGDKNRYLGKGVTKAVGNVNGEIRKALLGRDPTAQAGDRSRDDRARRHRDQGAARRQRACSPCRWRLRTPPRATASSRCIRYLGGAGPKTLPVPMMNIINGGAHADNSVDIQEFMILPVGAPSLSEALRYGAEIFHTLKKVLHERKLATAVGDEGGFAPDLPSNEAALETILEAIDRAGYKAGRQIFLGLDVASTEFFDDGIYDLESEHRKFTVRAVRRLPGRPGRALSDRDDRRRHERGRLGRLGAADAAARQARAAGRRRSVRDQHEDPARKASSKKIANAILIKVNQIGTLTETLAAIDMAAEAGYAAVVSHRSGETEDCDHRGHRRRDHARRRSRPARCRARTASRSTTSCCASKRSWAPRRATRAPRRSRCRCRGDIDR